MGRNLPLNVRRRMARGLNARTRKAWANRVFLSVGIGNRASLTTALAGANNDVALYARTPGTGGNSIRFRIVVAGVSTAASVVVAGNDITFNSATSAGSAAISTANEMLTMLRNDVNVRPLIHAQLAPGNDGTGVVAALAFTNLSGAT